MKFLVTAVALTIALASSAYGDPVRDTSHKIQFDLDQLDENGLYGPADGKRSLSYEFCIPHTVEALETVQAIDPSLMLYLYSPGRVGCSRGEVLAIGDTHQPNYRNVLNSLASLDSVEQIVQFLGE